MSWVINNDELYHHGIMGMKWGVKNGPPYPLSVSDHSASEKKAGWQKSLSGNGQESSKKKVKKTTPSGTVGQRIAKGVYDLNAKTYEKLGNKQMASMNRSASKNIEKKMQETDAKKSLRERRLESAINANEKDLESLHKYAESDVKWSKDINDAIKGIEYVKNKNKKKLQETDAKKAAKDAKQKQYEESGKEWAKRQFEKEEARQKERAEQRAKMNERLSVSNKSTMEEAKTKDAFKKANDKADAWLLSKSKTLREGKERETKLKNVDPSIAKNGQTRKVAEDYHKLTNTEFKNKYYVSKEVFAKRYLKSDGDTYSMGKKKAAKAQAFLDGHTKEANQQRAVNKASKVGAYVGFTAGAALGQALVDTVLSSAPLPVQAIAQGTIAAGTSIMSSYAGQRWASAFIEDNEKMLDKIKNK